MPCMTGNLNLLPSRFAVFFCLLFKHFSRAVYSSNHHIIIGLHLFSFDGTFYRFCKSWLISTGKNFHIYSKECFSFHTQRPTFRHVFDDESAMRIYILFHFVVIHHIRRKSAQHAAIHHRL